MLIDCLKINIHKLNLNRNLYNYVNKYKYIKYYLFRIKK